jgi:predicted HicB family RNase H-like nuclease
MYISLQHHRKLKMLAAKQGKTMRELVEEALDNYTFSQGGHP